MHRLAFSTLAALTVSATVAQASCPVSMADTSVGIYIDFDGYVVRYNRSPNGQVEELEFGREAEAGLRFVSMHGILVLSSSDFVRGFVDAATIETFTYDRPLPAQITQNMSFTATSSVTFADATVAEEAVTLTSGTERRERLGGCDMQVIPVEVRVVSADDDSTSLFSYFPRLGVAAFVGFRVPGEPQDNYTISTISTEPPVQGAVRSGQAPASSK